MDRDDRIDILEQAVDHVAQASELVRMLGDPSLDAYVTPQLEGQEGGWLGEQAVDHLRAALHAARHGEEVRT